MQGFLYPIALLLGLAGGVAAAPKAYADIDFSLERNLFLVAERALAQNNIASFDVTRQLLLGYPLLPYLDHRRLARNLSAVDPEEISRFLDNNPALPLADLLRNHYLDHLAKEKDWEAFLKFSPGPATLSTELGCHHRQALLAQGRREEALADVHSVWLHGRSQPNACDPVFNAWRAEGRLSSELAWNRFELAMEADQTRLARYLQRYLAQADRVWAERALEFENQPARVARAEFTAQQHVGAAWMLERAWTRYARHSHQEMFRDWQRVGTRSGLDAPAVERILRALGVTMVRRDPQGALDFIKDLDLAVFDQALLNGSLRAALRQENWDAVRQVSAIALTQSAEDERWNYWHARALESLGYPDEARYYYRVSAAGRNFHAFLAADRMGQPYRINHRSAEIDPEMMQSLRRNPAVMRMRELLQLERLPEARREWTQAIPNLTVEEQIALGRIFAEWGWYDRAIFTLARARFWDDIDLRFPLAYTDLISAGAEEQGIDPAWAMAVARQESAFVADARSSAGALGLMQIMPNTGRSIAGNVGVQIRNNNDILRPETNTRMGTYYLRRNLDGFQGHSVLSTAAYNAGVGRVRSWLPRSGAMDPDIWVELIPFNETRSYVERVFAYRIFYAVRMGERPPALTALLYPITPRTELAAARERHLALYFEADRQLASREICDAPGYSSMSCL